MSIQRKTIVKGLLILLIVALAGGYIALWDYSARWFDREIERAYANAEKDGIAFLGAKPKMENFPFVPEVRYTGGFQAGDTKILFPDMILRGYPIMGATLRATFPRGLALDGPVDPALWNLDYLDIKVAVPYSLPASIDYHDLLAWKQRDGKIDVRGYTIRKAELEATGDGLFTLDSALQPVFKLDATLRNHEDFIRAQMAKGAIEPLPGAIAITMLNGLATTDEATGERNVTLNVSVENRMLQVGPLQVLQLPQIVWDRHSLPDLRL